MKNLRLSLFQKPIIIGILFILVLALLISSNLFLPTPSSMTENSDLSGELRAGSNKAVHHESTENSLRPREPQKVKTLRNELHGSSQKLSIAIRNKDSKPDPLAPFKDNLKPRTPHSPLPLHMPLGKKIRLNVKFMDQVMARAIEGNQLNLTGVSADEVTPLLAVAEKHGLVFYPAFDNPEGLDALRIRAANRSGEMQADLNGTMMVEIPITKESLNIAQALQSISFIESVDIESLDQPPPPPADISPTTPNLESLQGYLGNNPGFGVNHLKQLGADGSGIRYSDCEYGFNANHEDLVDANLVNSSRADFNDSVFELGYDEHGTAAIGITMAQNNGYGVTGIAPKCEGHFYSEWTTLGYNRAHSVSDAVLNSRAGDVILLEMQISGGNGLSAFGPAELNSTIWNLCKSATDAGIIVVAAAGNGNQNLDDPFYQSYLDRGDSGAIIVGAGSTNNTHSKLSFSTHGARVDIQAWGLSVMTTGYGFFAKYGDDENQSYTSGFNGTSSASACVAGAVVLMQSYAKNTLDTLFTPQEMRTLLKTYSHEQGGSDASIGSAIALNLAVAELPESSMQMAPPVSNGDDIQLFFSALPFRLYKLEASEDLSNWDDLKTGISGSKDIVDELLPNEKANYPKRFYRLSEE